MRTAARITRERKDFRRNGCIESSQETETITGAPESIGGGNGFFSLPSTYFRL